MSDANQVFTFCPLVLPLQWSTVQRNNEALLSIEPVVIHRSVKVGKNIFGSTLAYGYQDMVFEVCGELIVLFAHFIFTKHRCTDQLCSDFNLCRMACFLLFPSIAAVVVQVYS